MNRLALWMMQRRAWRAQAAYDREQAAKVAYPGHVPPLPMLPPAPPASAASGALNESPPKP